MKNHILALLTFFLVTQPVNSFALSSEKEIRSVISELATSMNEKDLVSVLDKWTEDGEKFNLAGGIYRGRTELGKHYHELFTNSFQHAKYDFVVQYIRFNDSEHAVVDGVWKTFEAGPPTFPSCGIFLFQLVKVKHSWKLKLSMATVPRFGHAAESGRNISWIKTCARHQLKDF